MPGNRRRKRSAALLLPVLLLAACGSRLDHAQHLAAFGGQGSAATGGAGTAGAGGLSGTDPTGAAADSPGKANTAIPGTQTDGAAHAGDAGATTGPAGAASDGTPIKIGMLGNFSGVVGAAFTPARDAFLAWTAMVNDRGGVNGHPIQLFVADNGGDASRDMVIAKDFVENQGVIALANVWGQAAVGAYAYSKGVPVVGGSSTIDPKWNQTPGMFPASTSAENAFYGLAKVTADTGASKVAVVYCTENAICKQTADRFAGYARDNGLEVVYSAAVSLAQPDFTAECLNAKGKGATAIMPVTDGGSANRIAQSCARQGYRPTMVLPAPASGVVPEMEGAIALLPAFPWVLRSGSPALREFGDAMTKYQANGTAGWSSGMGWTAGKLLERALTSIDGTPTARTLLEALWGIQNDTLDGLAPPLSFVRDQPAPQANCGFLVKVENGEWTAPLALQLSGCRP